MAEIKAILEEDEFNDSYGKERLTIALKQRGFIISQSTLYRVLKAHELVKKKKRKPNGLTKADKLAKRENDLLNGDFTASTPTEKLIGDITQLPTIDGKLYIAGIYDAFNNECIGLAMADHMRDELTQNALKMAAKQHNLTNAIFHSDFGSQYTSDNYKNLCRQLKITQSHSLAKLSCYGNAKVESVFGRFKTEAIYNRYDTKNMSMEAVKRLVFRYFMGYWNNRRISSTNNGMPPKLKRQLYYESIKLVA